MLFGYPVAATAENWLHDCLVETISNIHARIDRGQIFPRWPAILPAAHQGLLRSRSGLKDRLKTYFDALRALSAPERQAVLDTLREQNEIPDLLCCARTCRSIHELPEPIRKPIKDIFDFSYGLLTDLGVRDRQYKVVYDALPQPICPFCGCENFGSDSAPREDLDHYLAKSIYPFAAANLKNLAPIGKTCNSLYKKQQDILRKADGTRRRSFNPYAAINTHIIVDSPEPIKAIGGHMCWSIEFNPSTEETITWDDVFRIRERYGRDILSPRCKGWLLAFSSWYKRTYENLISSDQELIDALEEYCCFLDSLALTNVEMFRPHVFKMILNHCRRGDQKLVALMKDVVVMAVAA